MKKRIVSLLLTLVFAVCFLFGCAEKKTDEELVRERIDTFVTAYNDGDFEGVLECFDAQTRNTLEATFNVMGGLVGGLTGFSFDMGDLFALGVNMMGGEVLAIEISEVSVDGEQAVAKGQMGYTDIGQSSVEEVYVSLVKEDDDWFIQDMTDEAPQESGGESGSNGGGTTSAQSGYKITSVMEFTDDRTWVKYQKSNESYYGFINKSGKILYSEKIAEQEVYNIGQGAGVTVSETECKVIGADGKVKATYNGEYAIKACGGGYAWVYQDASTITEEVHKYGIFDHTGAWVRSLMDLEAEGLWDSTTYLGDGMFAWREDNFYYIYGMSSEGAVVTFWLSNVRSNRNFTFENGIAYVNQEDLYSGASYQAGDGVTQSVESDMVLRKDGTYTEISTPDWFTDGKAVTKVEDRLQIVDYTKTVPTTKEFTKYAASMIQEVAFVGDYGLVELQGVDGKYYFTLIDVNGNELFEPIRKDSYYDDLYLYADGNIYWKGDTRVDKTGNQTEWTVSGCQFSLNTRDYIIRSSYVSGYAYEFYALNGNKMFGNVK